MKLTADILTAAIEGFQAQKKRIDSLISDIKQQLSGGRSEPDATADAPKRRRRMSAAARKRIGAAQRKRWAEAKSQTGTTAPAAAPKPKRRLSAAGRKRIIAATKKRWALVRAKAAAQAAPRKKSARKKAAPRKAASKPAKKAAGRQPETAKTTEQSAAGV
jgi:hypothetical protein